MTQTGLGGSHQSNESGSSSDSYASSSYASGSSQESAQLSGRQGRKCDLHPPGFCSLASRVDEFSGKRGDDNFEICCWILLRQPMTVGGVISNVLIGSRGF